MAASLYPAAFSSLVTQKRIHFLLQIEKTMSQRLTYDVVICTYNGEKYIKQQLLSIVTQKTKPKCIFIGDDGSNDNTLNIIHDVLSLHNIKYEITSNQRKLGYATNFFTQIKKCSSSYILLSDQDDVWCENKVEILEKYINENEYALAFFSNAHLTDKDLKCFDYTLWDLLKVPKKKNINYWDGLHRRLFVTGATLAINKILVDKAGKLPQGVPHDAWLAIIASIHNGLIAVPHNLILYRQHDTNILGAKKKGLLEQAYLYFTGRIKLRRLEQIQQRIGILTALKLLRPEKSLKLESNLAFYQQLLTYFNKNIFFRLGAVKLHKDYRQFDGGVKAIVKDIII